MEEDNDVKNGIKAIEKPMAMRNGSKKTLVRPSSNDGGGFDMPPKKNNRKVKRVLIRIAILFGVILVVIIALLSTVFTRATVILTINDTTVSVDGEFNAEKDSSDLSESLPYSFRSSVASTRKSVRIQADREEEVAKSTTGTMRIFNDTDSILRLKVGTRFRSENGLVYKTDKRVVIEANSDAVAEVYADTAGAEYNNNEVNLLFRLPGLQEAGFLEDYENVYGRNETTLTGGFTGTVLVADEEKVEQARETLRSEMREEIKSKLKDLLQEDEVLFDDNIEYNFTSLLNEDDRENNQIVLNESVVANILIFEENLLAQFIYLSNENITIATPPNAIINKDDIIYIREGEASETLSDISEFGFSLRGDIKLTWNIDEEQIKKSIAGTKEIELESITGDFPGVSSSEARFFPAWIKTIPASESRIRIERVGEGG